VLTEVEAVMSGTTKLEIATVLTDAADLIERREVLAMPNLIRDVPNGYDWGFFSNEDQRMHLQTLHGAEHYRVWLEERGGRCFEPADKVPTSILRALNKEVLAREQVIESAWIRLMIAKKWISFRLDKTKVRLSVYPESPHGFERVLDLTGNVSDEYLTGLTEDDLRLSIREAALAVGVRTRPEDQLDLFELRQIVFIGRR
jgi:hypothetical protein